MRTSAKMAGLLAATAAGIASAGSIVHTGSLPMRTTDWSGTLAIDQFDTEGGTRELVAVNWTVTGRIEAGAEIESLDASPTTVQVTLGSTVRLFLGDGLVGTATPQVAESFDAAAFDGVIDFAGPSGLLIGPRFATAATSGAASDLAMFIGTGQVPLTMDAFGSSFASGSGNVLVGLTTSASVEYRVEYVFNQIPTPGAATLLGIAGRVMIKRRR